MNISIGVVFLATLAVSACNSGSGSAFAADASEEPGLDLSGRWDYESSSSSCTNHGSGLVFIQRLEGTRWWSQSAVHSALLDQNSCDTKSRADGGSMRGKVGDRFTETEVVEAFDHLWTTTCSETADREPLCQVSAEFHSTASLTVTVTDDVSGAVLQYRLQRRADVCD